MKKLRSLLLAAVMILGLAACGSSAPAPTTAATTAPAAAPVGATCPNCGAPVAEGDAFCMSCGQKLQ